MGTPLFFFSVVSTKDKSGTDHTQIGVSATVNMYREGATTTTSLTIGAHQEDVVIQVSSTGRLQVADTINPGGTSTTTFTVTSVDSATQLTVTGGASSVYVAAGTRLLPTNNRPTLYFDDAATLNAGNSMTTDGDSGRAVIWSTDSGPLDFYYSGGVNKIETRHFAVSAVRNAADFASIQNAIDALPGVGGTVYIPQGTYSITATIQIPSGKAVHLLGDGVYLTNLQCNSTSIDPIIQVNGSQSKIEGIYINGPGASGSGRGLLIYGSTSVISSLSVVDCRIENTASWAVYMDGDPGKNTFSCSFVRATFSTNKSNGCFYSGIRSNSHSFIDCVFGNVTGYCVRLDSSTEHFFENCVFEGSNDSQPYLLLEHCRNISLLRCHFEHETTANTQYFIKLTGNCSGVSVDGCYFVRDWSINPKVINIGTGSAGVVLSNPSMVALAPNPEDTPRVADISIGSGSEVTIQGGVVTTAHPRVSPEPADEVTYPIVSGAIARTRLATLSTTERDAMLFPAQVGDLIFNTTTGKVQVCTAGGSPGTCAILKYDV